MNYPLVVAQRLSKSFGKHEVLRDVTAHVAPGDIIGVLGKNGAGKTTLLELMLGFTPATSGLIQVFGQDSFKMTNDSKSRVGFVPQQDELINQLSALDQLRVIGSFYRRWDSVFIEKLSSVWEIDLQERVRNMSVGQRQKLSILLSLGHHPDLLVLDEPVASLDPIARRQFLEQIIEISADGRRAVVLSSHIVSDIERLANKIWILKEQRLFWSGEIDALKESVVRVHVRGKKPLPKDLQIPNAYSFVLDGSYAVAVVRDWTPAHHARLVERVAAEVETQPLTLEEIFLEMHR
jgi:ABC-2 type transport system ATP-binding protein